MYTNRISEAHAELQLAKALDPYSALPSAWLGASFFLQNRRAEAFAELRRALEIDSLNGPALQVSTMTYALSGRAQEAAEIAPRLTKTELPFEGNLAYALALGGHRDAVREIVRKLEREKPRRWMSETSLAYAYLGLGDTARALSALERATDAREIWTSYMSLSLETFDSIRERARFAALIRRVGLQDYGFTEPGGGRPR